jgi:prevent-host-death family protein
MIISSTDAKNRFGQVLDEAQKRPVTIEKSGRRHSVVISVELYEKLVAAQQPPSPPERGDESRRFYEQYKDWVDLQNELVERHGIPGEEYRTW